MVAKLLVSNPVAGSVIGKAGANIEQLQRSSGARIQLSRTGEFYPGKNGPWEAPFRRDGNFSVCLCIHPFFSHRST